MRLTVQSLTCSHGSRQETRQEEIGHERGGHQGVHCQRPQEDLRNVSFSLGKLSINMVEIIA